MYSIREELIGYHTVGTSHPGHMGSHNEPCPVCSNPAQKIVDAVLAEEEKQELIKSLVNRFSAALVLKLCAADKKYGYANAWMKKDWMIECQKKLISHLAKGDPLDVAAYCAFMWHHGWKTVAPDAARLANEIDDLNAQILRLEGAKEFAVKPVREELDRVTQGLRDAEKKIVELENTERKLRKWLAEQ